MSKLSFTRADLCVAGAFRLDAMAAEMIAGPRFTGETDASYRVHLLSFFDYYFGGTQ